MGHSISHSSDFTTKHSTKQYQSKRYFDSTRLQKRTTTSQFTVCRETPSPRDHPWRHRSDHDPRM